MLTPAEDLAQVLAKHGTAGLGALPGQRGTQAQQGGLRCSCREWAAPADERGLRPWPAYYRHVAEVVLAHQDDEGQRVV